MCPMGNDSFNEYVVHDGITAYISLGRNIVRVIVRLSKRCCFSDIGEALEVDFDAVQHPDDLALLLEKTGDMPCECQRYFLYCGYRLFEVSSLCVTVLSVGLQDISLFCCAGYLQKMVSSSSTVQLSCLL